MEDLTTLLDAKDLEITKRKSLLQKEQSQGPGPSTCGQEDVEALKVHNAKLVESNAKLDDEVKSLTQKLLQNHKKNLGLVAEIQDTNCLVWLYRLVNKLRNLIRWLVSGLSLRSLLDYCYAKVLRASVLLDTGLRSFLIQGSDPS
ncbi:hypothetical protein R3W88_024135 [Solanum pinnatisectum]|uniref:Uncharacterized protein n=1 Tax=Solanum pinnatisectum TaxID=50273 RepID=A0AAV9M158_9SOLN|nr:hypothetical protein R3W88_024135 [Solanum pinnatisectum]